MLATVVSVTAMARQSATLDYKFMGQLPPFRGGLTIRASPRHASMKATPVCPKCGKTPTKLSERPAASGPGLLSAGKEASKDVICVYRCECGTTFSQTERREDDQRAV
jgi:hypothetical protein